MTTSKKAGPGGSAPKQEATPGGVAIDELLTRDQADLKAAASEFFEIVKAALEVGAIEQWEGSDSLLLQARAAWGDVSVDQLEAEVTHARDRVRFILWRLALDLEAAVKDNLAGGAAWRESAAPLRRELSRLAGYIDGLYRSGADKSLMAADRRRAIGDAKKERIRSAVAPFRQAGAKKYAAAEATAESLGLEKESLVKLLSQMYPGKAWLWPASGS
ncbi:MAG: hypothetical protein V4569_04495 [Pseudomonadota bacterium]